MESSIVVAVLVVVVAVRLLLLVVILLIIMDIFVLIYVTSRHYGVSITQKCVGFFVSFKRSDFMAIKQDISKSKVRESSL